MGEDKQTSPKPDRITWTLRFLVVILVIVLCVEINRCAVAGLRFGIHSDFWDGLHALYVCVASR